MSRGRAALITVAVVIITVLAIALTVAQFWIAWLVAAAFLLLFRAFGAQVALGAGLVWALFGLWEALIQLQITCDAECNIRIDFFLTFPVVMAASAVATWRSLQRTDSR
jgi:hypothetical protein